MIKHVVMFQIAEKNQAHIEKLVAALKGMEGQIEPLRFIEVGVNFSESKNSHDIVLITHFDDRKGLKEYSGHKNHLPVLDLVNSICSGRVVVDYETS